MCLEEVDAVTVQVSEGYKVLEKREDGSLHAMFWPYQFEPGIWTSDKNKTPIKPEHGEGYPCGFHFFACKADALNYMALDDDEVCHRVLAKDIVASGLQSIFGSEKIIVAKEIMIMEEVLKK